jgi:DNA (cytosine-5)-methyltransferase 1
MNHVETRLSKEFATNSATIILDQFSIYRPDTGSQRGEFAPLHHQRAKQPIETFLFDVFLLVNDARFYVQQVPFSRVSVGGYCDTSQHYIGNQVLTQSAKCDGTDTWYQLRNPAPEYGRYHHPSLWIANFA